MGQRNGCALETLDQKNLFQFAKLNLTNYIEVHMKGTGMGILLQIKTEERFIRNICKEFKHYNVSNHN